MNKKLDEILYDSLKPENDPASVLNRRILDRRVKKDMQKRNIRKAAVAAALVCVIAMGGVTAYAATQNFSLLSLFAGESKEVKKNAADLLDTKVEQKKNANQEKAKWANFQIKEAICDKNQVIVQVEVKAVNADKYLPIPDYMEPDETMADLHMSGAIGKLTIAEYAKKAGKECLKVGASISCDAPSLSIDNSMKEDGTLYYNIRFENYEKSKKLDYVCNTCVLPPESASNQKELRNEFAFSLTDKSDVEVLRYLPVSDGKIKGTELVVDEVIYEKSDLDMLCRVKYHYTGDAEIQNQEQWFKTLESDVDFDMLDSKGNIVELNANGGGITIPDETGAIEADQHFSLMKLPDKITFQAKGIMEKNLYGTVDVKRTE